MPTIDRTEFEQVILQIEKDLLLQTQHLGALLIAKDPTLAARTGENCEPSALASSALEAAR